MVTNSSSHVILCLPKKFFSLSVSMQPEVYSTKEEIT